MRSFYSCNVLPPTVGAFPENACYLLTIAQSILTKNKYKNPLSKPNDKALKKQLKQWTKEKVSNLEFDVLWPLDNLNVVYLTKVDSKVIWQSPIQHNTTTNNNKKQNQKKGQDYKAKLKTIATLALVLAMSELKAWRANFWLKVSLRHTAWWHRVACALRKCGKFNLLDDCPRHLFAIEQNLNECRPVLHFSAPLFLRSE